MRISRFLIAGLCVICIGLSASAQSLSLPLAGFYRTGRYMPVKVTAAGIFRLQATGVMPTTGDVGANFIIPVLITGLPADLPGVVEKLHALGDQDQLLGSTIDQTSTPTAMFIKLDPADPLPGPAVAWECLNRLVMDADSYSRVKAETISVLLAAGCKIEVIAANAPAGSYSWKKQNDRWILDYSPAGPTGQLFSEAAFLPTLGWAPGRLPGFLRQVFLTGVVLSIAIIALLLWRTKSAFIVMMIMIATTSAVFLFWKTTLPAVDDITGSIVVRNGQIMQTDSWLYERGSTTGARRISWNGFTHPMFDSTNRLNELLMSMEIGSGDRFAFVYQDIPGKTVAFVHRKIEIAYEIKNIRSSHDSPMQDLAKDQYLTKGVKISGEISRAGEIWPAVVIETAGE